MNENELRDILTAFNISKKKDAYVVINTSNILKSIYGKADNLIIKKAIELSKDFDSLDSINDYYYLTYKAVSSKNNFIKKAYPNSVFSDKDILKESDLEKWTKLVYNIYKSVQNNDMSFNNALEYYSAFLDINTEEDKRFKKWVLYLKNGEHKKYSSIGEQMKKESFQFPLNSGGFYPQDTKPSNINKDLKALKSKDEKEKQYLDWKKKLYGAIRRIDKLLRQSESYVEPDMQAELADLLHVFDMEVRKVRMSSTASDLAYKTANAFNKKGFKEGYDVLMSFAQEVPVEQVEAPIEEITPENESNGEDNKNSSQAIGDALEGGSDTGPEPGEYEELAGEIDLGRAAEKLEEIASRLADRRTIRQLAEFDIMLDKLGIASMFPELAEAQSKLIDAYSYSLVRVTKMLGMIASGKSLGELSDVRRNELVGKTMKEVDKAFESREEEGKEQGNDAIKQEFEEPQDASPQGAQDVQEPR